MKMKYRYLAPPTSHFQYLNKYFKSFICFSWSGILISLLFLNCKGKHIMTIFQLPNLTSNPKVRLGYIINNKQYTFSFQWLDNFCLLSIYIIKDNQKIYLIKGRPITQNSDLIERVKDSSLITGKLVIKNKYNEQTEITQYNFHTDFEMEYYDN